MGGCLGAVSFRRWLLLRSEKHKKLVGLGSSPLQIYIAATGVSSSCLDSVVRDWLTISAKQWLTVLIYHRQSTDTPPTVERYTADC